MSDPALTADPRVRTGDAGESQLFGRLAGHDLRAHGEAYLVVDCYLGRCATNLRATVHQENGAGDSVAGKGHALCRCGALSPHLPSGYGRRRWHRQHKARVVLDLPEPADQPAPVDPSAVA